MHQEYFDLSCAKARLHLSESPFSLPASFLQAIIEEAHLFNLYPEPASVTATQSLAQHWEVTPDNLVIANGCDEIILNTFLKFSVSGNVIVSANSYPGYSEIADLAGQKIIKVPLKHLEQDVESMIGAINADTKLAIICNPHNPTGTLLSKEAVKEFISQCNKKNVIPIIDEAYIDYASPHNSLLSTFNQYDNIIIWRSFAKSHGLAGIRLGAAVGTPKLMAKLKKAAESNPFSVNRVSQRLIHEIIKNENIFIENRQKVLKIRENTQQKLQELGVWCNPSHANFLFIRSPQGLSAIDFYKKSGIFVRDCSGYDLNGYWRVACGHTNEMIDFIHAVNELLR